MEIGSFTKNYNLLKPDKEDFYDVGDFNENADIIDTALKALADKGISLEALINGLADVAKSGSYNDLKNKPTSLPANGGNAETANALTVNAGSATQPVYFSGGKPIAANKLEQSVLSTSKLTDTMLTPTVFSAKEDLNNITTSGFYYWNGDNSPAHIPDELDDDDNGVLAVFNVGSCIIQTVYGIDGNLGVYKYWIRISAPGTPTTEDRWRRWSTYMSDGFGTAAKAVQDGDGNNIVNTYALKSIYSNTAINIGRKADTAAGTNSFACGLNVEASGNRSHAEGNSTTASANNAHAEGTSTIAGGVNSHTEGYATKASNANAHAEGRETTACGDASHSEGRETAASGLASHAEGYLTTAEGEYSHAEGRGTIASKHQAHAEGYNSKALGSFTHAEGWNTIAGIEPAEDEEVEDINSAHAEGYGTIASGHNSHAEGFVTTASAENAHAEGNRTIASRKASHAEGYDTKAYGEYSHAEGDSTTTSEDAAHAEGKVTTASNYASHAGGKYNTMTGGGRSTTQVGDVFVIGNGTGKDNLSNALRLTYTGELYIAKDLHSSGADYAEFIKPWYDGNPDHEDRVGYFVTIKNGLLYKADEGDYIAGITSGNPSVVGNADEDYYWRYERDEFNRIVMEDVPEMIQAADENGNLLYEMIQMTDRDGNPVYEDIYEKDEDGNIKYDEETNEPIIAETKAIMKRGKPIMTESGNMIPNARMKLADDYDSSLQDSYIERKYRKEWDYVGMVGVLPVRDDGTCKAGSFCKCGKGGIATYADTRGFDTYMVIERVSDNVVSVILK